MFCFPRSYLLRGFPCWQMALLLVVASSTSGLSLSSGFVYGQQISPSDGAEWPRFLGSNYDGVVQPSDIALDWNQPPKFLWSVEVGPGYGIGSVAGERFFQCDAEPSRFRGATSERLRCFDLVTGQLQWSSSDPIEYRDLYGYEAGPRSSPTVVGNRVLTFGVTGKLVCRQTDSGEILWSVNTNEKYGVVQNFFGVGSAPLVLDDMVIVMVGGSPEEDQAIAPGQLDRVIPNGSAVVAFDLATGAERWKCGDDLASYSSPRPIQIGDETLVLVFARGGLIAVDPIQGEVRWRFDHRASILESVNAMMPVVQGDKVLISECYQVGSVLLRASADSAEVVWQDERQRRAQAMRCHWATPVLAGDYLYGCSGRNAPDSDFRCIEFATGEVQWIDPRRTRSSVTRRGDDLVLMEERGLLQILKANPKEMELVAQWDLSEADGQRPALAYPCWSAPVIVGDRLLVRGDQRVICLQWPRKP